MARDDPRIGIHEDRVDEAEFHYGGCDLRHLLRRVRARVLRVRHQPVGRPDLNAPRHGGGDVSGAHSVLEPEAGVEPATWGLRIARSAH